MKNIRFKTVLTVILSLSAAAMICTASLTADALSNEDEMMFSNAFNAGGPQLTHFFVDQNTKKIYIKGNTCHGSGGGELIKSYFSSIEENGKSKLRDTYLWEHSEYIEGRGTFYINDIKQSSDQDIADAYKKWLEGKSEIIVDRDNQSSSNSYDPLFYKSGDFIEEYNKNGSQTRTVTVYLNQTDISLHSGVELNEKDEKGLVIEWTSDDTSVATIDKYGELTPVSKGECLVTAKIAGTDVILSETKIRVYTDAAEEEEEKSRAAEEESSMQQESSYVESSYEEPSYEEPSKQESSRNEVAESFRRSLDGDGPSPNDIFHYVHGML